MDYYKIKLNSLIFYGIRLEEQIEVIVLNVNDVGSIGCDPKCYNVISPDLSHRDISVIWSK